MGRKKKDSQMPMPQAAVEAAEEIQDESSEVVEELPQEMMPEPSPEPMDPPKDEKVSKEKVKPNPVKVVALRAGFYGGYRRKQGDKFTADGNRKLGSWMKKI